MIGDPDSPETIAHDKAWEAACELAEERLIEEAEDCPTCGGVGFVVPTDEQIAELARAIIRGQADDYPEPDDR